MTATTLHPPRRAPRTYDLAAFHATVRPTDVFLCTYPKSGTTWLGYLVAQAIKADPAEALDLKSFNRYVPDVNLLYTKRGSLEQYEASPGPRLFLCHAAFDAKLPNVVYVMRDPRDVLLSYWHYQKFLKPGYDQPLLDYLLEGNHWPCDWDLHVASWLFPKRHDRLVTLRYEDMHADPANALARTLALAGITRTDAQIAAAVEASQFDRMRRAEETHGVHGKAGDTNSRFVRKGRAGGWRDEMSNEEVRVIEDRFGDVMRAVGYETVT